jgi:bilirubin oxidase
MKAILLLALLSLGLVKAYSQNLLAIPDTLSGNVFELHVKDSIKNFHPSFVTNTMAVNADYLGPTLLLQKGDSILINVHNDLMDTTTIHWHGMHVSPMNDGGPHNIIAPGEIWSPSFTVRDNASTYWYHPHLHMMTNMHATLGAAGMIIVRDAIEATLTLPRKYAEDDFPLVLQSKCFDSNKQIVIDNHSDSVLMVNGTLNPYLPVPAQVIRLRLLNASSERVFRLGMNNNMSFYQIASDGGLLNAPVLLTRLQLAPGERAEILINLSSYNGQTLFLNNYGAELVSGIYGAAQPGMGPGLTANLIGYSSNVINGTNNVFLQLNVVAPTSTPITIIPSTLVTNTPYSLASSNANKTLTFSSTNNIVGPFLINGNSFDMDVINYSIPKDNIETWTLSNQSPIAHPFHIHDVQFYLTDINGNLPPANMQGRKDVVLVMPMQTVTFITKFETFCDEMMPYMFHCHMLPHEDDGMMGQFLVMCPTNDVEENNQDEISIYPNPSTGIFQIKNIDSPSYEISITDMTGRTVFYSKNEVQTEINLSKFSIGFYDIRITTEKGIHNLKYIKD